MIISNNHVLADVNTGVVGDDILQPGPYDGGTRPDDVIAHLGEFVEIEMLGTPSNCTFSKGFARIWSAIWGAFRKKTVFAAVTNGINKVDCALAQPVSDSDVSDEILEVGEVTEECEAEMNMKVKYSGRTTGMYQGEVKGLDGMAQVNMGDGKYAIFEDQIVIEPSPQGGDSGSCLLTEKCDRCIGLIFAGGGGHGLANKWKNIKAALSLD